MGNDITALNIKILGALYYIQYPFPSGLPKIIILKPIDCQVINPQNFIY